MVPQRQLLSLIIEPEVALVSQTFLSEFRRFFLTRFQPQDKKTQRKIGVWGRRRIVFTHLTRIKINWHLAKIDPSFWFRLRFCWLHYKLVFFLISRNQTTRAFCMTCSAWQTGHCWDLTIEEAPMVVRDDYALHAHSWTKSKKKTQK